MNGNGHQNGGDKARWAIYSTVMLALAGAMGSGTSWWIGQDANDRLATLSARARDERIRLVSDVRREIDRIEADNRQLENILARKVDQSTRIEMLTNLQGQIDRLGARIDRLESAFVGGVVRK